MFSKVIKCLDKSNPPMNTKCSKTNRLQKNIKYRTNLQGTKYLNLSIKIQSCQMFGNIRFMLAVFASTCLHKVNITLY